MRGIFLILSLFILQSAIGQTNGTECVGVRGFYVTDVTPVSARLVWEKDPLADGYLYAVSKNPIPPEKFGKYTKETDLIEVGLASGTTYYMHLRVKCHGTGISKWSTIQFNTPPPLNTAMLLENTFAFSVYPLQAERSVTIKIKGSNEMLATVWVMDMYGTEVGSYPLIGDRLHIDVATLPEGIYSVYYNDFYGRFQHTRFTKFPSSVLDDN